MAEGADSEEVVCVVHNIPKSFHSRDLRNYFSQFLEKGSFVCFHYRHRPEVQHVSNSKDPLDVAEPVSETNDQTNASDDPPHGGKTETGSRQRRPHAACCATLKLLRRDLAEFIRLYDRKHWVNSSGSYLSQRCFISRLRLPTAAPPSSASPGAAPGAAGSAGDSTAAAAAATSAAAAAATGLQDMIEFRPPADMPRGNVGTPTAYFLTEIQRCRLPASLVKRLGLVFPRAARRRQYSSVPLDYGTAPAEDSDDTEDNEDTQGRKEDGGEVRTARGAELLDHLPVRTPAAVSKEERSPEEAHRPAAPRASDETDAEETDRHEALHDDVTAQGRTKERLYEEEIELVWEKGGPGLVWYTDAVFWDEQRGDFDERTADDWDVDMAGYEPGAGQGDMDATEARRMRQERRLRGGDETESAFERRRDRRLRDRDSDDEVAIGAFERHTRGFGRRVLLNLGWSEGRGLGAGAGGIAEPLEHGGQTDRRGFGFVGEKLDRRPTRKRRGASAAGVITTVFDSVCDTELEAGVDVTLPPTHMKFRRSEPPP